MNATAGNGHDSEQSLLTYPCRFDLKVVGRANGRFEALAQEIVTRHVSAADLHAVQSRPSRDANYIAFTFVFTARSREQLDALYRELSGCAEVLFAL
jgi:putative lipoic acid-binding regulatory protein